MSEIFNAKCTCGKVETQMTGEPRVRGICHCGDCRELLNIPYHAVNAWEKDNVAITTGQESIKEYQHPKLNMKRVYCESCGEVVYNTNGMDWRIFSQHFIKKNYNGELPELLRPKGHFFYGRRIVDINDELPKKD